MKKRELLSPADDTASHALVDVQAAITRVKEIITEGVSKAWPDKELTDALNKAISAECKNITNEGFREQFRKSLVVAARKWHYELKQTYRVLDRNFQKQALRQPLNVDLLALTRKTPFEKQVEFRKLLDDGTNPGIPVIKDYQSSVKLAIKALSAEPPKIVTMRNGKAYAMPARLRAEMAVRYSAAVENLQRLQNEGVKWCWISSHANCSPRCKEYQGKLYSLFDGEYELDGRIYKPRGTIDGIPYRPINEALAGPKGDGNGCISGYNCRHRAIEYERGSKAPADFTEAEIKREYAIDKQQRSYENRIRQLKQEEKQLRACGMEKEAKALRKKWRILTKDYQIYSIEHDRAYYPYRYVIDRSEELDEESLPKTLAKYAQKDYNKSTVDSYVSDDEIRSQIGTEVYPMRIHEDRQGKHIVGHKNLTEDKSRLDVNSVEEGMYLSKKLIERYSGKGQLLRNRKGEWNKQELIISDETVGYVKNLDGKWEETNRFIIHYSKTGVHIVPTLKGKNDKDGKNDGK